jgi:hypothetical protein
MPKLRLISLEHWTYPHDVELKRTRTPTPTGIKVHLWGGWEWELSNGRRYRTNGQGEGLWRWMDRKAEWNQIRGTCQFRLPQNRRQARAALNRHLRTF